MGMAASQARFLGLTARKTNTEFEGQQVNQERTMLSNQSANYYNELLGMAVPVPPSVEEFTKTVYSFKDGAIDNQITSLVAKGDGNYMISYNSTYNDDFAVVGAPSTVVTKDGDKFLVGSTELRALGTSGDTKTDQVEKEYLNMLNKKYGEDGDEWLVRYVINDTTEAKTPYFYKKSDLERAEYSKDTGSSLSNIKVYTVGSDKVIEEHKAIAAKLEQDMSGRLIQITLKPGEPDEVTYSLITNTVTDEVRYNDAMNQYNYTKLEYDQYIEEVNAKIEIVQAQDRNLELRLKQLDTEQKAISTEMDAVTKVIQKNTESTFKTFG